MSDAVDASRPRIAVVTGGSRGLGASTVLQLARRGIDCVLTYRRDSSAAGRVVAAARDAGAQALALRLDTRDTDLLDAFVPTLRQALGDLGAARFDYLVNNAGVVHRGPIASTTEQALDLLYEVQFKGVFLLTQALLSLIADGGRIVNVSTGLARTTTPGCAVHACMMGAIEVFTRYLAEELRPRRIAVDTVAQDAVPTPHDCRSTATDAASPGSSEERCDMGSAIATLLAQDALGSSAEVGRRH